MVFNTLDFMLFLPAVILLYFLLPQKLRNPLLLLASYFFYLCDAPVLILFLIAVTLITYAIGRAVGNQKEKGNDEAARKWMVLGIVLNLGTLAFYKYFNFLSQTIFDMLGEPDRAITFNLLVPLGISFIIFQTVSYIVDVHRGTIPEEKSLFRFALYVSFFPKVIQGPIEKAGDILPQFDEKHEFDILRFRQGAVMILFGLFMKMVIADNLAIPVNQIFGNLTAYTGAAVALATVMFAFQIYCDFAGYSLIAIGAAKILGFTFQQNFDRPYLSKSASEFWRRWHMSLNVWLRDYLYIPLGGSRCSNSRRVFNTLTTFGLSGLWHGADWGYVIWGLLNGFYVSVEGTVRRNRKKRMARKGASAKQPNPVLTKTVNFFKCIGTFVLIALSWIFFRAQKLTVAVTALKRIFLHFRFGDFWQYVTERLALGEGHALFGLDVHWRVPYIIGAVIVLVIVDLILEKKDLSVSLANGPRVIRWAVCMVLIFAIIIFGVYGYGYDAANFIYGAF